MKTMGMPEQQEQSPVALEQERLPIDPEQSEALTGVPSPEADKQRQLKMLIDSKILELEQSQDPNALDTINFWKQRKDKLVRD